MNVKITKDQHKKLCSYVFDEYMFGSQLHGIAKEDSDKDYIRVIPDGIYKEFNTLAKYLPNIHSWQYDDVENNTQYVWMTKTQFYRNLFSGDGNMIADVVLLGGYWANKHSMFLCRTYKIIKGYLGVAKRDLKLHGNQEKKRFHAHRSLMMAEKLMENILPTQEDIVYLKNSSLPSKEELQNKEILIRDTLNTMLNNGEIDMYPKFQENNELLQIMTDTNNIREFKY